MEWVCNFIAESMVLCVNKNNSIKNLCTYQDLIETKKTYFWLKIITYPYTEVEKKLLLSSYMTIDKGYSQLESSLKLMKICLDMYKDSL